jgi:aarF domain-containing kinase
MKRIGISVGACGAAYLSYRYKTDEGFERSIRLWTNLGPVVAHYRAIEFKHNHLNMPSSEEEKTKEFDALHERYCIPTAVMLRDMKGMYTKYAQICAGFTDLFPPIWINELRTLEDQVTPKPIEVVKQTIREDFGRELSTIYSEFDEEPLGSASIGQVHRAKLASNGLEVAVKVQYPDSVRLFKQDMETIRSFMEIAAPEQVITLSELEKMFEEEFDYVAEARNLVEVHKNMTEEGHVPSIAAVPLPYSDLCTKRVLTMDLVPGKKLVTGLREYASVLAEKEGKTLEEFEQAMKDKIDREGMPSLYDGPGKFQVGLYRNYLYLYDNVYNSVAWLYNTSLGWTGISTIAPINSKIPLNTPEIIEKLMQIHACQLFRNGCFNADPHAGNFLMLPDDRIGLIDFGATKRLTRGERLTSCVLYVALKKRDKEMVKDLSIAGGYKSKYMKMENIFKLVEFGFDSFGRDVTNGKNIQQFTDELYRNDPWEEVAGNLVMAQFLSMRLRSMAMQMGHPIRCSHYWGDYAEQVLREEGCPYEMWNEDFARQIIKDDIRMSSSKGALF